MAHSEVKGPQTHESAALLGTESAAELTVPNQRLLKLHDGRTLAYSSGGDETSKKVFVSLHGVFGVGAVDAASSRHMSALGWYNIAPTLPGWGVSSPWPEGRPLSAYVSDIAELLQHTVGTPTHVVVFGGSYGSVWAYAVAANNSPAGMMRIEPPGAIRGLLIFGGFTPYADEGGYAAALQGMTTLNWLTVGRPGRSMFVSWIHRLFGRFVRSQLISGGMAGGLSTLRQILTGPSAMTPPERAAMVEWAESQGMTFEEWEMGMARNIVLSVRETIEGYDATPGMINSEWGLDLADIHIGPVVPAPRPALPVLAPSDVPHELPPVVIAGALRDHLAPIAMQRWVAARIPGAQMVELQGNHISAVTTLKPIIAAVIRGIEAADGAVTPLSIS
jgi:pimeloyl-ACP methyl ester carboxylesterase